MINKAEAEKAFFLAGLSDRTIKALIANNFESKDQILIYAGKDPRKLLKLEGIGEASYSEIMKALEDKRLDQAERRYQAGRDRKKAYRARWENRLAKEIEERGLQGAQQQFRFHADRNWALDFAFLDVKLGIEIDGGIWLAKGGHNTGKGYLEDRLKEQAALLLGWVIYRVVPEMITSGQAIDTIAVLLEQKRRK